MSSTDSAPTDDSYVSRPGQTEAGIPVQRDDAPIADGVGSAEHADSDAMLEKDDKDAIDTSNILDSRTRGATKEAGTYREPGDEEGLPGPDDGTSAGRQ